MAVAGSLTYSTEIDTKGIKSGLSQVESDVKSTGSVLEIALGNIVADLARVAVDGLKEITMAGIDYNAQMESYQTSFKVMLGDAEEANELLAEIKEVGAKTPFEFSDLAKGSEQLLAYGVASSELIPVMTQLGDISLGNKEKFDSLVLSYGKMQSTGKVTLEYLNLMTERGFNPLNIIAEQTGVTMEEMYERVSAGEVTFEEIQGAIETATSEGGQFFNGMEEQSKTFNGQMSTLADNVNIFLGDAFKPLFDFLAETAIPALNDFFENIGEIGEWFEENETAVTLLAIAIGTITAAIIAYQLSIHGAAIAMGFLNTVTGIFAGIMAFITSPITLVVLAIGALIAIIYVLAENWEIISEAAANVWEFIKSIWQNVAKWFNDNVIKPIINFFTPLINFFGEFAIVIIGLFQGIWEIIARIWEVVADWFNDNVIQPLKDFFAPMWEFVTEGASKAWEGIKEVFSTVTTFFGDIFSEAWDKVLNIFSAGGKVFSGIKEAISDVFKTVLNALIGGLNSLIAAPFDFLNGILNGIRNISFLGIEPFKDKWKQNPISVPQIPLLAQGGVVSSATLAMIGEDGQEAVVPLQNNTEWTNKVASLMLNAIKQDKTYNPSENIISSTSSASSSGIEITAPIELYLDGEKVYNNQQKITFRKQIGGTL